jgi:hypothetical protein
MHLHSFPSILIHPVVLMQQHSYIKPFIHIRSLASINSHSASILIHSRILIHSLILINSHQFIHSSIHSPNYPLIPMQSFTHSHSFILIHSHPFPFNPILIHPFIHVQSFIHSFIHSDPSILLHPSILMHPFSPMRSFIRSFPFIRSHACGCPFSFIHHSSIHSFINIHSFPLHPFS